MIQPYGIRTETIYIPGKPARDPAYLRFVRSFPCSVCKRGRSEAAHTGPHGIGQKASDYSTIPLCHKHHTLLHACGPRIFESQYCISIGEVIEHLQELWNLRNIRRSA